MNTQIQKLSFIEEYLRITDESILDKLAALLKKERQKKLKNQLNPMTMEELQDRLHRSEEDIRQGRIFTQTEVESHFKNKFRK